MRVLIGLGVLLVAPTVGAAQTLGTVAMPVPVLEPVPSLGAVPLAPMAPPPASVVRPTVVAQTMGAPVVIERTEAVDGRVHARVRVRNLSTRPIAAITFVVTVGDAAGISAVRASNEVPLALAPGHASDLALRGLSGTELVAAVPVAGTRLAELGVLAVTFGDGTMWTTPQPPGWLERSRAPVPLACLDAAGTVHSVGEIVGPGLSAVTCRPDGVLGAATEVEK